MQNRKLHSLFSPTHPPVTTSPTLFLGSRASCSSPSMEENPPQISLSPSNSVNRRNSSPEFEFWMVTNPSFPQTTLLSADELIVDGVLLPLDLVSPHPEPPHSDSDPKPSSTTIHHKEPESELLSQPGPGPESATAYSSSKRWRDIFKMGEKRAPQEKDNTCKEKKKDRKASVAAGASSNGGGGGVSSSSGSGAELNINIWPFSRSWSGGNRSRIGGGGTVSRKVSSAPCSRSNSAGESKSRKWPNSPSRGGGVHLGRNSPVWQLKRGGSGLKHSSEPHVVVRNGEKGKSNTNKSGGGGGEVGASKSRGGGLNLNVPMCIGYRQQLSCRRDENILLGGGGEADNGGGGVVDSGGGAGGGNKLMYLRTLFTKKVY